MNRIEEKFANLKARGESALIGFVTAGDPDPARSVEILEAMCSAGIDILELGIPFSDPTADGPVIQRSSGRALKCGIDMARILDVPVQFFFDDMPGQPTGKSAEGFAESQDSFHMTDFLTSSEGAQLIRAFAEIQSADVRRKVIDLVKSISAQADH